MKRPNSLPVLASVAALAALAVIMSQLVTIGLVILSPEPRPSGFSPQVMSEALSGRPAVTPDGRALKREIGPQPLEVDERDKRDPLNRALVSALSQRLGVPADDLRIKVERGGPPRNPFRQPPRYGANRPPPAQGFGPPGQRPDDSSGGAGGAASPQGPGPGFGPGFGPGADRAFTLVADRATFDPFAASLRLPDGTWATVQPPHSLLTPWQKRLLVSLLISMLVLAPIVWLLARRLTRPIRVFAEAAARLGADPDAAPLVPSGPTEVRTAIAAMNDMQASLRDHMRKRTQTIAAIAHDLRTPLTRLRFRVEQAPEPLSQRMSADIEEMDALIGQAMAFVRGAAAAERREALDLGVIAHDCATGFSETGADVTFDGGVALPILGDPDALRRAVANLIGNAVKYAGSARLRAFHCDRRAVLTIDDDGPGVPPEELEAVFEPFARGERSRNRETGGVGLGLAVARQGARACGGEVTLENRDGGGLRATLSLPLAVD